MELDVRKRYLQVAFNGDLAAALDVVSRLPRNNRIFVEAGTPFIKQYGLGGIERLKAAWGGYLVADMKVADGGAQEVELAASAGADAVTILGSAPTETLVKAINACKAAGVHSVIDMLGVSDPLAVLRPLYRTEPDVVELHKGRDEETTRGKVIEYKHVKRIKSKFNVFIGAAGGVDLRQAQTASFNGANIVVVNMVEPGQCWTGMDAHGDVADLAEKFLKSID